MHILHIVHQMLPEFMGGIEVYTRNVSRAQVKLGQRVSVIAPSPSATTLHSVDEGVSLYHVPVGNQSRTRVLLSSFYEPTMQAAIAALLPAVDIVHVQHLMGIPLSIFDQIRAAGIPYVITLNDYWWPCANAQLITNYDETICAGPDARWHNCARCALARAGLPDRAGRGVIGRFFQHRTKKLHPVFTNAAHIIAVSNFVRNTYRQLGFDNPHFSVVPTGIQPLKRVPSRPHDGLHAVFLGSIAHQKGVEPLIRAFNALPHNFSLTVAGGLDAFPDYARHVQALATHPNIRFVGQVAHDEIGELLASADFAILPTLWYEASPLTIDEFFAAGLPVIASDIGAMSEKIRHDVDGLLFPVGDVTALQKTIHSLHQQPERLAKLKQGVRLPITIDRHTIQIMQLYEQVRHSTTLSCSSNR